MALLQKVISVLSVPLLIIAMFIAALYLFQNRLLYLPSKATPDEYVPAGMELWLSDDGLSGALPDRILGLVADPAAGGPAAGDPAAGTAIIFHGNAGHAGHREYYAQQLTTLGLRVILAEYPGYGPRPGKPDEAVLVNDAVRSVKLAHQRYGQPVWLIGESLGAGVAAAVAGHIPSLVQGIVLITPWNRLVDVASHHYPFLPVRWLLTSEYDSIQSLALFTGPKLVIVADGDNIVPTALGVDLFQAIDGPKRLITINGAGHNNWTTRSSPSIWVDAMQWLRAPTSFPQG